MNTADDPTRVTSVVTLRALLPGERECWESLASSAPNSCFMQAWAWADFKELEGYLTFRTGLFWNDVLVGGCIFQLYPSSQGTGLLVAPGGPVLPPGAEVPAMQLLLVEAQRLAGRWGAIALRIEPLWKSWPAQISGFVRAPADLLPAETLLIDLTTPPDRLHASMKPKGRYNLRLNIRHGVVHEFSRAAAAIPVFYDLFWQSVGRQGFYGEPYGFFINLCQTLFAVGMAEIGIARWRGQPLAAILIVTWGKRATYLYGGRCADHPEVMAAYGLHWQAMLRAREQGCHCYDFYGYTRNPHHAYARFSQFKAQFGGTPATTVGAHDYFFYDELADVLVGLLQQLHDGMAR